MPAPMVITARFPLGTFLGHRTDGAPDPFPDTARLHAALTHAAGQATTAERDGDELRPSAAAISALRWLEQHPPSELQLPQRREVAGRNRDRYTRAWRDEGVMEGQDKPWSRRVQKAQSDAVALAGTVGWRWEAVPDDLVGVIDNLCADVSCLGETDSPVVLEVWGDEGWKPTHSIDETVTIFPAPGGLSVRTPVAGRFDELEADYRAANPTRHPKPHSKHSWSARPGSATPSARSPRPCSSAS